MREKIVAGNWKMNLDKQEALSLYRQINTLSENINIQLIAFPPALYIDMLAAEKGKIPVGAQNFYPRDKGAFTGELSIPQLKSTGATYVLIGHSERRLILGESDDFIREKVNDALEKEMKIVFCCGEPLEVREQHKHAGYVREQLENNLFHLEAEQLDGIIIAYEPIWAIGTGKTASSAQAEEMHKIIRESIADKYSPELAEKTSILYGGSCNPSNAKELFSCPNVDGGLIGGAALNAEDFIQIATSF